MFKFRDLTIVDISPEHRMVITCDSSGGIGDKDMDVVKAEPEVVGYFAAHVALMELLAVGARPITIVNNLGVEMDQTGTRIINGIKRALEPLNIKEDIPITGSTEENFPVCQTFMGITVIGIMEKSSWRSKKPRKGDLAVLVGMPKVGQEILEDKGREIMSLSLLMELLKKPYIMEILPVGSKGIQYELGEMAKTSELEYEIHNEGNIDLYKSAGPATCAIVAVDKAGYEDLKNTLSLPVNLMGIFI